MISKVIEIICCTVFVLGLVTVCTARPPQSYNDPSTQGVGGGGPELDSGSLGARNLLDGADDLTALKMQLLAQQLAEYNAIPQLPGYSSDRFVLSKRQQRYRQCYFNPISCFRK